LTKTDTKCPVHSLEVCWFQPTTQASESFVYLYFLLTLYRKCKNFQIIISQTTEPVGNGENVFSVQEVKRKSAPTRAARRFGTVYTLQSRLLARIAACTLYTEGQKTVRTFERGSICTRQPLDNGRVQSLSPSDTTNSTQQERHTAAMRLVATITVETYRKSKDQGRPPTLFEGLSEQQRLERGVQFFSDVLE